LLNRVEWDTQRDAASQPVAETILQKIRESNVFVGDRTYVDAPHDASRILNNSYVAYAEFGIVNTRYCRMSGLSMRHSSAAGQYGVRGSDPNRLNGLEARLE